MKKNIDNPDAWRGTVLLAGAVLVAGVWPAEWVMAQEAAPAVGQGVVVANAALPTAEMIRKSDMIVAGRASVRDSLGAPVVRFGVTGLETLKGPNGGIGWLGYGFSFPAGQPLPFANNDKVMLFGRWDSAKKKLVPVEGAPVLAATPENIAAVRQLVAANPVLKVSLQADKTAYKPGEPIVLTWTVENVSPDTVTIYIGPYALQYDVIYDNTAHGTGSGGSDTRKPEHYVPLKPGEKWSAQRTVKGPFPEGEIGLRMIYDAQDNVATDANRQSSRVPGVVMLHEERHFSVAMAPPDAATVAALRKQLQSPLWDEQMEAMRMLSSLNEASAMPEVRAMATHPWPAMRVMAARALTQNIAWSPQLRALLFDPHQRVRAQVSELIRQRQIADSSLSLLALKLAEEEATKAGLLDEKQARPFTDITLIRLRDLRLGDIMAERIKAGGDGAYVLNSFADMARENRMNSDQPATEEQKAKVLTAWAEKRKEVQNPYTTAQLNTEISDAKKMAFADLKLGPQFTPVRGLLMDLAKGGIIWNTEKDARAKELEALGAAAGSDALLLMKNFSAVGYGSLETPPVFRVLAASNAPGAFEYLLSRLYDGTQNDSSFFIPPDMRFQAAMALARLDGAKAKPHLEKLFGRGEFGAAVALASLGEKKAVPLIMEKLDKADSRLAPDITAALAKVTGQNFPRLFEWTKWWQAEGKNQTW